MTVSDEVGTRRSRTDQRSPGEPGAPTDGGASAAGPGRSPVSVYRWSCPICGDSRVGMASGGEDPLGKAEFSLRQHVKTSDDDGHGPANRYPPGFDPDAADRAVSVD